MRKVYRKLTKEQKARGVIFSSALSPYPTDDIYGLTVHEVNKDDLDISKTIARLKDDSFFNASHFKYNIIRR